MNTNKWGIRVSTYLALLALFGAIIFDGWWQNFSFAIFGSALLSAFICCVNYKTLRKESVEKIVFDIHKVNIEGFSTLYATSKDLTLEQIQQVLNVVQVNLYEAMIDIHNFKEGLFWFNKNKYEKLFILEVMIFNKITKVSDVAFYIEYENEHALKNTKKIYKVLDDLIDDNKAYKYSLEIAKKFGSKLVSMELSDDVKSQKKKMAEQFKKKIETQK